MNTFSTAARRVAGVAAVSALSITAFAGTALAETAVFKDAHGDMSQGADIRKVRVINGEERLKINVVHRDLVRSFRSGSSISVFIDTDATRKGPEYVFVGGTFEGADYALLKAEGFEAADDQQVPLHGGTYAMKLDYVDDVARITIDQVVLKDPAQVRVEVKTGAELLPEGSTRRPTRRTGSARRAQLLAVGRQGLAPTGTTERPGTTGPGCVAVSRLRRTVRPDLKEQPVSSRLNPYISFDGDARQAMEFYQEVFGGELHLEHLR